MVGGGKAASNQIENECRPIAKWTPIPTFFLPFERSVGEKKLRFVLRRYVLDHHAAVAKFLNQTGFALYVRPRNSCQLVALIPKWSFADDVSNRLPMLTMYRGHFFPTMR